MRTTTSSGSRSRSRSNHLRAGPLVPMLSWQIMMLSVLLSFSTWIDTTTTTVAAAWSSSSTLHSHTTRTLARSPRTQRVSFSSASLTWNNNIQQQQQSHFRRNKLQLFQSPWPHSNIEQETTKSSDGHGMDPATPKSTSMAKATFTVKPSLLLPLTLALGSQLCFGAPSLMSPPPAAAAAASMDAFPSVSLASSSPSSSLSYTSDAVTSAVQALRDASGKQQQLFEAYQQIGQIITEGKGVGGSVNYKGVQLERGYVADEDTTIYNPGLFLLTEGEKNQLVQAVIQSRNDCLKQQQGQNNPEESTSTSSACWSDDNQLAFDFLREKLDPLHMVELRPYLSIFPVYVAVVYAGVLAVQQLVRDLFPVAYLVGVAGIVLPILVLVALGT